MINTTDFDISNYNLPLDIDDNSFYKLSDLIENKVRDRIKKRNLTDIIGQYRNFNNDLTWINDKYQELVIEQITEDLITDEILFFYKKKY